MEIPFKPYSTFALCGATQSGKTTWLYNFLQHIDEMFEEDSPREVLYCYGVYQPLYDDMKAVCSFITFHAGVPTVDTIQEFASGEHKIVVLDDLLQDVVQNVEIEKLFTLGSHHKKLSVFFLSQNLFQQGRCARTIALNTAYLILFKNYRDTSQLITLGRQLVPGHHNVLIQAYKDATTLSRYGYLVLDMSPHTEDRYRWRTRIFPGEFPIIYEVYK